MLVRWNIDCMQDLFCFPNPLLAMEESGLTTHASTRADCKHSMPGPWCCPAEFVGAWEELKAEEERRAAEEAQLFKTKTRSTDIATEEQARLREAGRWLAACSSSSAVVASVSCDNA